MATGTRSPGRSTSRRRSAPALRDLGLTPREASQLRRLATPEAIQRFVSAIPANHELHGETTYSVREVLRRRRAHCIEGAFVAACALWLHGEAPLLMHLDCAATDAPHVVALFRRGTCWGAISKSNSAALRYRDPVYRTLRELALSYLHEYCDRRGARTLRSFSRPFDLRRIAPAAWITSPASCAGVDERLAALPHVPLVTPSQARALSRRDAFERRVGRLLEHPRRCNASIAATIC
jgi:hypothetical protein